MLDVSVPHAINLLLFSLAAAATFCWAAGASHNKINSQFD
jgi:hypothetical protein